MAIGVRVRQILQGLLFPQCCVLCDQWTVNAHFSPLCRPCLASLPRMASGICLCCGLPLPANPRNSHTVCSLCRQNQKPFDRARSWGPYQGTLRTLIHKFKFHGYRRLAYPLSDLLVGCCREDLNITPDWIIPVPLHPEREKERGFDQTRLLARELSRTLSIPLFWGLSRVRNTLPLTGLDPSGRRRTLRRAFTLVDEPALEGGELLVIDDVMTTGATASEICRLLHEQTRVKGISIMTLARVLSS